MKRVLFLVLQALGILVFCVGFLIVPLASGLAAGNVASVYPEFGWAIGVAATILWLLAGVHLLIRPDVPGFAVRTVASVIVFVALFIGGAWFLDLPRGCISELPTGHSLLN